MNKEPSKPPASPGEVASPAAKRKKRKKRKANKYFKQLKLKKKEKKLLLKEKQKAKTQKMQEAKTAIHNVAESVSSEPQARSVSTVGLLSSDPQARSVSTVGLLKCLSPWLRRDGVYLGLLLNNSVLTFGGCVGVRVLAGLVLCNGYLLKPSPTYHILHSPHNHPHLSFSPMDPQIQDEEFNSYLAPFRNRESLHFHSISNQLSTKEVENTGCKGQGCLHVDVGVEDIAQLNQLVKKEWNQTIAVVLLRAVRGNTVPLLNYWTQPRPIFSVSPQVVDGFQTVAKTNTSLTVPPSYLEVAWELAGLEGVRVLVCGEANSGKSTLCRFLINYLLNRYPCVCYVECDPGQPEFTVPEVVSLHTVTAPLLGPPYTHVRKPYKAYYFGDKTPQSDPEYYLSLLKALHSHYVEDVCSNDPTVPLVINTCGWISDMGVPLFLDIVRVFKPTHIIRTVMFDMVYPEDLPPLSAEFLNTYPVLFRTRDVTPFSEAPTNQNAVTPGDNDNDVTMFASSDEALSLSDHSSDDDLSANSSSSSDDNGTNSDQSQSSNKSNQLPSDSKRVKQRRKRKKLKISGSSFAVYHGSKPRRSVSLGHLIGQGWLDCPPYRVFYLRTPVKGMSKNSRRVRRLTYLSYFSGLFPLAEEVARQHKLPNPHGNMLQYAPPLEIPWKDAAVHICHKHVPNCQALYALNGKVVALGHVDPWELCERDPLHPDVPRFLKSDTPLIEFIGLGVMRGIDASRRVFCVTTPECDSTHSLTRVNIIALGNPDHLDYFSAQQVEPSVVRDCPYCVHGYQCLLGMFSWTPS